MLDAHEISFDGRHGPLFTATSVAVDRGDVVMAAAAVRDCRTALALVLSGRMRPSSGTVTLDGDGGLAALRARAALIDAPGITEPETHLTVRALVSETLALLPGPPWRMRRASTWLRDNDFHDIRAEWVDTLDPATRLTLLTQLALADPRVELLVIDSPHRHGGPDEDWVTVLRAVASGDERPVGVVAVVREVPAGWTGPTAAVPEITTEVLA